MKFSLVMVAFFAVILAAGSADLRAQTPGAADSALSVEKIESVIEFLQDSAGVANLVERLRLIAGARREAADSTDASSLSHAKRITLFEAIGNATGTWKRSLKEMDAEIRVFIETQAAGAWAGANGKGPVVGGGLRFLVAVVIAMITGALAGLVLLRISRQLRGVDVKGSTHKKNIRGIVAVALSRCSFGIGGAVAFLLLSNASSEEIWANLLSVIAYGYGIYTVAMGLIVALFTPRFPHLRTIPCADDKASAVVRQSGAILRIVLLLFILHRAAILAGLVVSCRFLSVFFQVVMTVLVPMTLYRLRPVYMEPFRRRRDAVSGTRILLQTGDMLLSRLYIFVFVYGAALTAVLFAGGEGAYRRFLGATLRGAAILCLSIAAFALWHVVLGRIDLFWRSLYRRVSKDEERMSGNIRVVAIVGYTAIAAITLFLIVRIAGFRAGLTSLLNVPVMRTALRLFAIAATSWIVLQITYYLIDRFQYAAQKRMASGESVGTVEVEKRIATLSTIFRRMAFVAIIVIAVIMFMDELGFDVKAMIAGVGIVGVAVGFGSQNLVRDVISGLFVIFENRIRVGDVAVINGTGGTVEQVNLRTIVLRSLDGTIHVFPNGEVTSLSNMTHEYSFYVFSVGVSYREDTDRVSDVLREVGLETAKDPQFRDMIMEPLEVLGVDSFADSAVIIKARIKTVPVMQWAVGREINRRIKKRFDELGIEIPFPQRTIHIARDSQEGEGRLS